MINKTLALVRRALSVDSRDARSHLFRAALGVVVLWTLVWTHVDQFSRSAPGLTLFQWISYYNYWFITVAGATFFATAITEEKEERTLSLLKMAGVGPASLLLGKWIPRLTGAVLLIGVQIPFTVLAITLGGVLSNQIGAAYLALFAHLFFVGNLGLLASVVMRSTSAACGLVVVLLFLFHVLPFLLMSAVNAFVRQGSLPVWAGEATDFLCEGAVGLCALWRIDEIMTTGFGGSWFSFQVIGDVVAGLLLVGLAWLLFEPCTRNETEPGQATWLDRLRHLGRGKRQRRAWGWPLVWKDFQYLSGGPLTLSLKLLAYVSLILIFALLAADWRWDQLENDLLGGVAVWTSLFALVLESAVIVTRVYRSEMTQRTWSTLYMLPYSLSEVAYSKLIGALLGLLPASAVLFGGLVLLAEHFEDITHALFREEGVFFAFSYFWLQVLLAVQVAGLLSILFRWAAWPLAIFLAGFVVYMGNMMIMACLFAIFFSGAGDATGIFFLLCCKGAVLNGLVHYLIARRLTAMAAE
jgi:ABC-type transport system involved in multi-copper enzyme maturation permease subunit